MEQIPRNVVTWGKELLKAFPAVVIQGARQVGKSTLAGQLVAGRPSIYLNLDDQQTRDSVVEDPVSFVNQAPDQLLVIDEIQRIPELMFAIKSSIDQDRRPGRFLLTGSADLLHIKGRTDTLAGRAATLNLRGLSQGEKFGVLDDFIDRVIAGIVPTDIHSPWTRADYVNALAVGSYPELQEFSARIRSTRIDSYIERVLVRDAAELPSGGHSERLASIFRLIAAAPSAELVKGRLAQAAGIPAQSITSYLDVLQALYLVDMLPAWSSNLTKRETGRGKIFVSDPAVALRLARLTEAQLMPLLSDFVDGYFEAFVAEELLKQQTWSARDYRLFHFRNHAGIEVDIVAELDDGRIIGIEVKSAQSYRSDQFKGLKFLRDNLKDRFIAGVVLGMASDGFKFGDRLFGLPASSLWNNAGPINVYEQTA